jgi:hypothetical protein
MAKNYTLRIWTNEAGDFVDQDFDSLAELYPTIFDGWQPEVLGTAKDPEQLSNSWAVYDNTENVCINSINATQVGLDKSYPRQEITA